MADRVVPGPVEDQACIREAVCINTRKIFDSCRDKDCVDDLRVYPTLSSQSYIENALSVRAKNANCCTLTLVLNRWASTGDITLLTAPISTASPERLSPAER